MTGCIGARTWLYATVTVYSECTHVYTVLTTIKMIAKENTVSNCMSWGVSRGGKGPAPPPLEIEKQKKRSSEQILSYFTYILLLFLVGNINFSAIF